MQNTDSNAIAEEIVAPAAKLNVTTPSVAQTVPSMRSDLTLVPDLNSLEKNLRAPTFKPLTQGVIVLFRSRPPRKYRTTSWS